MTRPQLNSITRLARAGALEQAWALFNAGGYTSGSDDPDVLTVYGRLLKDRAARESGAARDVLLSDAIAAYERASVLSRATYPLINAATLAFLAGRGDQARKLATRTLDLLDSGDRAPDSPYWLEATKAEALLLLGRTGEADAVLGHAIAHQPEAWEDHASTLRQFSLILHEAGSDAAWLDRYRPPPSVHFEGILGLADDDAHAAALIEERIGAIAPGNITGALAAGADMLIAESALRHGGHLHVVLPCPPELFREASVGPFGQGWDKRFETLMGEAASVIVLDDWQTLSNAAIVVAREAAMGFAIRESRRLQSLACAVRICGEGESGATTGADYWERLGLPLHRIAVQRSNTRTIALPARGRTAALLAVPEALSAEAGLVGSSVPSKRRDGRIVYEFGSLNVAACHALDIAQRHPDAQVGLDYRAMLDDDDGAARLDRVLTIASASLNAAAALTETAALALTLHMPAANVQPMGSMRATAGDLPIYGLFPDSNSVDQLGE